MELKIGAIPRDSNVAVRKLESLRLKSRIAAATGEFEYGLCERATTEIDPVFTADNGFLDTGCP